MKLNTNQIVTGVIITVAGMYAWEKFVKPRV